MHSHQPGKNTSQLVGTVLKALVRIRLQNVRDSNFEIISSAEGKFFVFISDAPQQVTVTPNKVEVPLTQSITLTCVADGFPKPTYAWKFNGRLNGVRQNTFTLTNADVSDAGNYTCVATNDFGSKEATRVVYVECE